MFKINIKPLSVNEAFQGRRFKTNKYKVYEEELLLKLPNFDFPVSNTKDTKLCLTMNVGFSNKNSDLSNSIKAFEDVLQKKYVFNDKMVFKIVMQKEIVKKGQEFIAFEIGEMQI